MIRLFFLCIFFLPVFVHAQVLISEVAWMGTDAAASNEWIEIYNFSDASTDLTGWSLTSADGKISITLTGILSPRGVGVLERTDDQTLSSVTALQIYTGDLVNGGTTLTLTDPEGKISDEVIGGEGWASIGGSNVKGSKMTPQRTRTNTWVTGTPTPGAQNVQTNESIPEGDADTEAIPTVSKSKSSGGGSAGKSVSKVTAIPEPLSIRLVAPKMVYVNQPVQFEVVPEGSGPTIRKSLSYTWNFGDMEIGDRRAPVHTFAFPGEYIVVVQGSFAKQTVRARQEIKVLPASISLTSTPTGDIQITNNSPEEIDLGGYILRGQNQFNIPPLTLLKAKGSVILSKGKIGNANSTVLVDPKKAVIAVLTNPTIALPTSTPVYKKIMVSDTVRGLSSTKSTNVLATEPTPEIASTTDTIIKIGSDTTSHKEGIMKRFFKKFGGIF